MEESVRYDRQLRLWGEEGQSSIRDSSVCVLGSSALATEILKNLVLAGIGSFCIFDDANVELPDLGQNFFLSECDLGRPRAEVVVDYLKELNPSVKGLVKSVSLPQLSEDNIYLLENYTVVVGTNLPHSLASSISCFLHQRDVPFISSRVFGLIGYLRISVKEHTVANCHEDNPRSDLRLDQPFPALLEIVNGMKDLSTLPIDELKHVPYILLLFKALDVYRMGVGDPKAFPGNYAERKLFSNLLRNFQPDQKQNNLENIEEAITAVNRVMQLTKIPPEVVRVIQDVQCSPVGVSVKPFWVMCTAIRRFAEKHGVIPLSGRLPDMTSDSKSYSQLATAFHNKALLDAKEVYNLVHTIESERSIANIITSDACYRFCKHVAGIRVLKGSHVAGEENLTDLLRGIDNCEDMNIPTPAVWLLLLKAADRFAFQKGRYPGTNGVPCTIDSDDLLQRLTSIIRQYPCVDADAILRKIGKKPVEEMCRYGSGEPHVIASFLGGVVAQEVIKLATNQFIPINNTFVYDGLTQNSETFNMF